MMASLTSPTGKNAFKFRRKLQNMILCLVSNNEKQHVKVELVHQGIIPALIKDLDSCDPDTENPSQRV